MKILGERGKRSDVDAVLDRIEKESEKLKDIRFLGSARLKAFAKRYRAALDKVIELMKEAPAELRTAPGMAYSVAELGIGTESATGATDAPPTAPTGPAGALSAASDLVARGPNDAVGASVVGPTGAQGSQGIQGGAGPFGANGPTDNVGSTGPSGPSGITGSTGAQGAQGNAGGTGSSGPTELPGPTNLQVERNTPGKPLVDRLGNPIPEGEVFPSDGELLRHLLVLRWQCQFYESSKLSQKQQKAAADDRRMAAWGALDLCKMHGIRPSKTKKGTFCRLAAALYGDPSANLLPHCQDVLKKREAREAWQKKLGK
jgi:hypothetical protein